MLHQTFVKQIGGFLVRKDIILKNFKNINLVNLNKICRYSVFQGTKNLRMSETEAKKAKEAPVTIGTHDGIFHCDEILACFMLQQLPKYSNAKIIRSRNEEILKQCDIVVDVGGVFDEKSLRFDHHQKSFEHSLSSLRPEFGDKWTIKLSSAGLIYTFYGQEVIANILKTKLDQNLSDDVLTRIYEKVYEYFIQEIDAIDNGIPMYDAEPLYKISTSLSNRVGNFNEAWNSPKDSYNVEEQFEKAKQMAGEEFVDKVIYFATVWWPARSIVIDAINDRFKVHASGEIIELSTPCPWKQHLFELEKNLNIEGKLKYVLFQNKPNDFRAMCVPNAPTSFVCRKFLHKDWRGLRDKELSNLVGVDDAVFCHATGFIGGGKSREASYQMAVRSLEGKYED